MLPNSSTPLNSVGQAPQHIPRAQETSRQRGGRRAAYLACALALLAVALLHVYAPTTSSQAVVSLDETAADGEKVGAFPIHFGHPNPPSQELWGDVTAPYPTGASWLNLAVPGTKPAAFYPYAVRLDDGVAVSYGAARRQVTTDIVADIFAPDLTVTSSAAETRHYIQRFDALSVTIAYELEDGGKYYLHLVKGAPYITLEFDNVIPSFKPLALLLAVNEDNQITNWQEKTTSGSAFELELSHGQTWMLYMSDEVTFAYTNTILTMQKPFTGTVRLAKANEPSDIPILTKYRSTYPIGGEVSWEVDGDKAAVVYNWKQEGAKGPLLMFACPHHMDSLQTSGSDAVTVVPELVSQSMKGSMTAIEGGTWTMELQLSPAAWTSERGEEDMPPKWAEEIKQQVKVDAGADMITGADPYDFGKVIAERARVSLIAEAMGDNDARDTAQAIVAAQLVPWLEATNLDNFVYDKVWGGVVARMGLDLNNFMVDFANAWYCDHHFHYGYIIYAAAVVIRSDPSFFEKYNVPLMQLVHDISSYERTDEWPMARHKDWYDFHSWASGVIAESNGKSQESISEAINAYYAVSLFGQAINDKKLEEWGRLLMTMEIRAGKHYWQMPSASDVYPEPFSKNHMVGFVGALDARTWTWFGSNQEYIHCINQIPFIEFTEEWLTPAFVEEEYPVLSQTLLREEYPPQEQWKGFIYMDQAIIDRDSAWENVHMLDVFDEGNSLTNMLYWIATRPAAQDR